MNGKSNSPAGAVSKDTGGRPDVDLAGLVMRAAHGDQGSFRELYDRSSGMVHAVAMRILASREDAEEVVLDVYMRAWRNAASYDRARGSPLAWLLMMARSTSIDRLRQKAARPQAGEDLSRFDLPALQSDPEQSLGLLEQSRVVRLALAALPLEQQEALRLAYYSGLTHTELADQLGEPLGTVKTRIRLGLQRMRRALEQPA
jgi:RNA polymerase sigma-70 factor, ECF subfamily